MAANTDANSVKKVYQTVIDEVIQNVRDQFLDEGYDEQILYELKSLWEAKLNATRVFQNQEEASSGGTSAATARLPISASQTPQSSVISAINALPSSHIPTNVMQTIKQSQQQQVENLSKVGIKQHHIVNNQTDGNGDMNSSDDDDEDIIPTAHAHSPDGFDDDDEDEDDITKTHDDAIEGLEDADPLNSGDDISEHDLNEIFDTDNVIICQYEKLTRIKTRWKFHLKDGVMNINGKDYLFSKATGDAEWM